MVKGNYIENICYNMKLLLNNMYSVFTRQIEIFFYSFFHCADIQVSCKILNLLYEVMWTLPELISCSINANYNWLWPTACPSSLLLP